MGMPDHTYLMSKQKWKAHRIRIISEGGNDPGPWKKPEKPKKKEQLKDTK